MLYPLRSMPTRAPHGPDKFTSFQQIKDGINDDGAVWNQTGCGKFRRYMLGFIILALLLALGLGLGLGIHKAVEIEEAPVIPPLPSSLLRSLISDYSL